MFSSRFVKIAVAPLVCAAISYSASGAEESIDSLLNRLPSPQKMVRPRVQQALQDPATKDPLASRAFAAAQAGDYNGALRSARELANKDPKSAFAHLLHGATAIDADQWSEASAALHASLAIESGHGIT